MGEKVKMLIEWEDFGAVSTGSFELGVLGTKLVYTVAQEDGRWFASLYGKPVKTSKTRESGKDACEFDLVNRMILARQTMNQLLDDLLNRANVHLDDVNNW